MPSTDVSQMCPKLCNCMWNAPIKSIPCHTLSRVISAPALSMHCTGVFLISILDIQLLFDWPLISQVFEALQLIMRQGVIQTSFAFYSSPFTTTIIWICVRKLLRYSFFIMCIWKQYSSEVYKFHSFRFNFMLK